MLSLRYGSSLRSSNYTTHYSLEYIKNDEYRKNKVLDGLKKDIGEEKFINKDFDIDSLIKTEDDHIKCRQICQATGIKPNQLIDFIKSLY